MIIRKIEFEDLKEELKKIGVDEKAYSIFEKKSETMILKIYGLDSRGANILKQEFLSKGGDVAVHKNVASFKTLRTDALLIGTEKTFQSIIKKLEYEPYFGLDEVREAVEKSICKRAIPQITIREKTFNFNRYRYLMGALNITPDSFSDGGKYIKIKNALNHAREIIAEGAEIIDIGGESTRPGSTPVDEKEELKRVIPIIEKLRKENGEIIISIDTYKSSVAREALKNGADMINDISGLTFDENMVDVANSYNAPVVVMHIKGTPRDMQKRASYEDIMKELLEYFEKRINELTEDGIKKIIIDPGIGFAKTKEHNLKIIRNLMELRVFNLPILIGISKKSFIGSILDKTVDERENGTIATNAIALQNGAHILRVHNVRQHRELIKIFEAVKNA
jgi:dihydropteroate synthase